MSRTASCVLSAASSALLFLVLPACQSFRPPYPPEKALETFLLPEGFRVELVAAEPAVADPVAMTFDPDGRLYVVEMPDYPMGGSWGRIKLLEDSDDDGRFEKSTIFAEGLGFPTGILPWKDGVLVTAAPDILYFADTDGDRRADVRRVVLTGFAATNPQLRVNGLLYGIDNWIYAAYPKVGVPNRFVKEFGDLGTAIRFPEHPEKAPVDILGKGGDLRFKPDEGRLEHVAGNSQFGNAFDRWGNRFTVWNNNHVRHVVLQNTYLANNPHLAVETAMESVSDHGNAATLHPRTIEPLHLHESEIGHFTSACGISVYEADSFPEEYRGAYFVCDPVHNVVHCDMLVPRGVTFVASRKQEDVEFLASTDSWFRPVFTQTGPDGALYVVDFYRRIVEHPEWMPPDLLSGPHDRSGSQRGRIYRVRYGGPGARGPARLRTARTEQLVETLSDPNYWRRITAQRLLVEREDPSASPSVRLLARSAVGPEARLHALWTLEGLRSLNADDVVRALADSSPELRVNAIRLAERFLSEPELTARLAQLGADPDIRVRFQLACTLGLLAGDRASEVVKQLALDHLEDPWFQIAALASSARSPLDWLRTTLLHSRFRGANAPSREGFLRKIASILGARQEGRQLSAALLLALTHEADLGLPLLSAFFDGLASGLRKSRENRAELAESAQNRILVLSDSHNARLRKSVLGLLARLRLVDNPGLRSSMRRARQTAGLEASEQERRADAIFLLGLDPTGSTIPILEAYLKPDMPEALQRAAARALLACGSRAAMDLAFRHWRSLRVAAKETILQELFQDRRRLPLLLEAIALGTVPPASLSRSRKSQLLRFPVESIRARARALFGEHSTESRMPVLARYQQALRIAGDTARGEGVFREHCGKCHRLGGIGHEVGPDLASVANRTRQELLAQIIDPNASVTPGYEEYLVETRDGRWITGIIARETGNSVTLRRAGGEDETLLRSQISNLASSNVSGMPEDLERAIPIQQMADLLAYIKNFGSATRDSSLRTR